MAVLPPGNILQNLYLKERLRKLQPKSFCEIGSGNGYISNICLERGIPGIGYDLNTEACNNNAELNRQYVGDGTYKIVNGNFLEEKSTATYDFIISCMVIEHLNPDDVDKYFAACRRALSPGGRIVVLVPAGMKFWGIEDEIAGHFKRYAFDDFQAIAQKHSLRIANMSGLTYPISNMLLGLSNRLVSKSEGYKQELSMEDQTVLSGNRNVKFKTEFPPYFKVVLNEVTMYPFHVLQKMNARNADSMVIYCEFSA
jgi:SAM-dependent methyltransferase